MRNKYLLIVILLLFSAKSAAQKTINQNVKEWKDKLQSINNRIEDAFESKTINDIMKYYDDKEPTCMPEYYKTLYTKNGIAYYYQQWFDNVTIKNYKRDIYEVLVIKNYLIEIGHFTNNFITHDGILFDYEGKYMNVWRIEKNQDLTLISEIWGSDTPIDKSVFSFLKSQASDPQPLRATKSLSEEVKSRNDLIAKYVKKREGEKHATEMFTNDAIYMTYDTPMLIGMENIKPYFIEHEKPNEVSIDFLEIKTSTMIALGNFVIEYGYYHVDVSWDKKKGQAYVTGKSTNLWKRDENGVLKLYRQMVNHD